MSQESFIQSGSSSDDKATDSVNLQTANAVLMSRGSMRGQALCDQDTTEGMSFIGLTVGTEYA